MISYSISEIKSKDMFDNIFGKCFLNGNLTFWTRRPNFFHKVVFNQCGQLSAGSIKDFF